MTAPTFISTGTLPPDARVQQLVDEAYERFLPDTSGSTSDVYPQLAAVDPDQFGVCVVGATGHTYRAGDVAVPFSIMSVSKPFVFALVCEQLGEAAARDALGVNSTGLPFNATEAVTRSDDGRTNPMVNPGAITATGLVQGGSVDDRWEAIRATLDCFAGRELALDESMYASASASNLRNRELAALLDEAGALPHGAAETLDLYTRQCSLEVTAEDLAVMGATLADGGVNPRTGERVVSTTVCRHVLAVMATAGMYEHSGEWLYDVGLPGKSGIGGGIVTVSPGKGGLGTFAPRLDAIGNSVRGTLTARFLAQSLGLDLFASQPL